MRRIFEVLFAVAGAAAIFAGALVLFLRVRGPLAPEAEARARRLPILGSLVPVSTRSPAAGAGSGPTAAGRATEVPQPLVLQGGPRLDELDGLLREARAARAEVLRREEALRAGEGEFTRQQADLEERRREMEGLLQQILAEKEALRVERERLEGDRQVVSATEIRNLKTVAQLYENMGPEAAAAGLKEMEDSLAARILVLMNPRKSGKVMERLDPERAATYARLMKSFEREKAKEGR